MSKNILTNLSIFALLTALITSYCLAMEEKASIIKIDGKKTIIEINRVRIKMKVSPSLMLLNPDSNSLVVKFKDDTLQLYNTKTGNPRRKNKIHNVFKCSFKGNLLGVMTKDGTLQLYNAKTGQFKMGGISYRSLMVLDFFKRSLVPKLTTTFLSQLYDPKTNQPKFKDPMQIWSWASYKDSIMGTNLLLVTYNKQYARTEIQKYLIPNENYLLTQTDKKERVKYLQDNIENKRVIKKNMQSGIQLLNTKLFTTRALLFGSNYKTRREKNDMYYFEDDNYYFKYSNIKERKREKRPDSLDAKYEKENPSKRRKPQQ